MWKKKKNKILRKAFYKLFDQLGIDNNFLLPLRRKHFIKILTKKITFLALLLKTLHQTPRNSHYFLLFLIVFFPFILKANELPPQDSKSIVSGEIYVIGDVEIIGESEISGSIVYVDSEKKDETFQHAENEKTLPTEKEQQRKKELALAKKVSDLPQTKATIKVFYKSNSSEDFFNLKGQSYDFALITNNLQISKSKKAFSQAIFRLENPHLFIEKSSGISHYVPIYVNNLSLQSSFVRPPPVLA